MNKLQLAMDNADVAALETVADEIGREAVKQALAPPADDGMARALEHAAQIELQRQRDLDAALADSVEIVARQRTRLGRRTCTQADGKAVRMIFETLRGMQPEISDPGFPSHA